MRGLRGLAYGTQAEGSSYTDYRESLRRNGLVYEGSERLGHYI